MSEDISFIEELKRRNVVRVGVVYLIAAWLLAFTLSLDDLVIASFVTGPGASTLPIVVFSSVRLGVSPKVNALATILIVVVMVGVLTSLWLMRRYRARLG